MESLKGFNYGGNICCFEKTTDSSENNRMGQLKTGGRMNNLEISKKSPGKKGWKPENRLSIKNGNKIVATGIEITNIKNVK